MRIMIVIKYHDTLIAVEHESHLARFALVHDHVYYECTALINSDIDDIQPKYTVERGAVICVRVNDESTHYILPMIGHTAQTYDGIKEKFKHRRGVLVRAYPCDCN